MKTENRRDFKSNIRIAAACATTIMLLVFVTFSSFYIAREAEHNCTDEDCPICSCIEMCASTLNHIEDG
ncbi:MAG: hypothetical protein K6E13_08310, partial [Lachnospiraceae bacterium]|nr:hypothetical protein [Lachnospiraceae bacterium]